MLVFGSVALGQADERSDVDILVVCRGELLSIGDRLLILSQLGSGWRSTDGISGDPFFAGSEPLFAAMDSGGRVDGIAVELHYQSASWITDVLTQVMAGAISTSQLPFRPDTLAALIQRTWVLDDRDGLVARWRQYSASYPEALRQNVLRHFSPLLRDYAEELVSHADRRLGPMNFIFSLDRAVDAAVSILFALNDMYDPAEKRTERTILPTLARAPEGFMAKFTEVLEGPFDDAGALYRARLFERLVEEVLELARSYIVE